MITRRRPNPANIAPIDAQEVAVMLATGSAVFLYFGLIIIFLQPLGWIWAPLVLIITAITGVGALLLHYLAPGRDDGRSAGTHTRLPSSQLAAT